MVTSFSFLILLDLFPLFFSECCQRFVNFINPCKEPALCCLKFCIVFLFFIAFNSALILIVYFLSQSSPEGMPVVSREKQGDPGRGGNIDMRETWIFRLPMWRVCRLYPQPRYVPWLGIKPMTLCCTGQHSYLPSHLARGALLLITFPSFCWLWAPFGFLFVVF